MRQLLLAATLAASMQAQQPATPSPDELSRRLGSLLDSLAARDEFSGVVVLGRGGKAVIQKAVGFADREARVVNTTETAFNLGSINKVFTATAIRQLALDGKLSLDSTLIRYLPDYPNPDVARRVTIRQLLEMRSGIGGNIFAAPPGGTRQDVKHNRDYIQLFANQPLEFEPGTDRRYSNAGYIVLGAVIERVSGEDYYDYVRKHIYDVAGMTRTAHHTSDALPPNTARGYTRGEAGNGAGPLAVNTATLPGRGSAAGGGYSTAQDLLRFVAALHDARMRGGPPAGIGAAGGAPGINAVLDGALPGGYDLVVLSNIDPPSAERVARTVRGWLGATN